MASKSYDQTESSSASTLPPALPDVFLSFIDIDTKYTFMSHLYAALDRHEVRTFKDDIPDKLISRESILEAIKESKTYVVVLSENYAFSSRCLDELVEIISCCKSMGRRVVPVYYNIEPSHVHHQTGSFGEAFEIYETYFDKDKLAKWRVMLAEVANIPGHQVGKDVCEADIINKVVNKVLLEINPIPLDVARYSVGLDSRVQVIKNLMSRNTEEVTRIGIHGMGGIGKTTLAKAVYNQNYQQFEGSSFLENVREDSRTEKGLVCLQQQLINDVLKCKNIIVDNVDQGIELIRARIGFIKVLIVIDDLDNPMPLEFLEGPFAAGSIIIITTRNEDILDLIKVQARYKVNELGYVESRQLFTQHAFGNDIIPPTFRELSEKILECAGGLPLALKVFGSNLCDEGMICIDKLKQLAIADVEEQLLISFDGLERVDSMLQDMFLDIACFFIGQKKEEVLKIMSTCYRFANRNINILVKRCFLTINSKDELEMHNLLRDMGRNIVCNNSPGEPEKYSRLWELKDIYDVLKNHKGTEVIEGIIPHNLCYEDALKGASFSTDTFKEMSNLRFLYLENVNLTGSFQQTFENLKFLCWKCCPLKCLPSEFCPEELVILELPHSRMIRLWELNTDSQVFERLKTLNTPYSLDLTTTLDFTKLRCLETLNLEGCKSLEEVHKSIGSLAKLVSLNFSGCVKLKSLPDTICKLRALEVLRICDCISLKALPIELGSIETLKVFDAKGLRISKLPDSMERLSKLVDLNLSYNKKLYTLPYTVYNLRALKSLDISGCEKLQILPDQLSKVTRLRELHSSEGTLLKEFPDTESNHNTLSVEMLDLSEGVLTSLLSDISQLSKLENLYVRDCWHLLSVTELPPNLKSIWASGCTSLKRLPNLCNLKQLEMLDLTNCKDLTEIQGLEEITALRELHLGGCNSSLVEYTLEKCFFQMYTGFGQQVSIYGPLVEFFHCNSQLSYWNSHLPDCISHWNSQSNSLSSNSGLTFDLPSNVWHNFLGMILCFEQCEDLEIACGITLKNTTSDTKWSEKFYTSNQGSCMVIVPRSVFAVRDGDDRIELTANSEILGIHLLYKRSSILGKRKRFEAMWV